MYSGKMDLGQLDMSLTTEETQSVPDNMLQHPHFVIHDAATSQDNDQREKVTRQL